MFGSPGTVGRPSESASVGPPGPFGSNRVCICGQGATKRRNSQEATPEQGGRSWERRLVQAEPSQSFSPPPWPSRSEEHTSELQSHSDLVCRLLLEKKKKY